MIVVNLDKAKNIAHNIRREAREQEFAPHDAVIAKQIPGDSAVQAEAARKAIREKYAQVQTQIDAAQDVDSLKEAIQDIVK